MRTEDVWDFLEIAGVAFIISGFLYWFADKNRNR